MTKKILLSIALLLIACFGTMAQATKPKVMVMEIKAEIDPRMARYVKLALEHAEATKADYVFTLKNLIDMNVVANMEEILEISI